ncbi:MAG: tyrosine-protein phosphatase [Bacilli bacterium]|nr:tyrosine-protein phosphatase [Bacilli bacterium]
MKYKPEIIHVAGVKNFRGLGGIKVGGRHFKYGLAFRSGSLHKIRPNGEITLQKLGIQVDIDLRTESERIQKPDPEIGGMDYLGYDLLHRPGTGISREKRMEDKKSYIKWLKSCKKMEDLYVHILSSCLPTLKQMFGECVSCLLENKPFLFHCSAGKDRTGLTAFLILGILGAEKKEIVDDYLLTRRYEDKKEKWRARLVKFQDYRAGKIAISMVTAKRSYIEAAFSYIEKEGGFHRYATEKLGLGEATIEALKENCLE